MPRFSALSAVFLLIGSPTLATAQGASAPKGDVAPVQCWDLVTNQTRQRTAEDASRPRSPAVEQAERDASASAGVAGESGSSEGMTGMTPGSKGSASNRRGESPVTSGRGDSSSRPPGMPDC
jgi:hypothetical protein